MSADHEVTISPGDAYGDPQLWCTYCWPQWLGPVITGLSVPEVVELWKTTQVDHDRHIEELEDAT